jgi:N-methylhydantoinase B
MAQDTIDDAPRDGEQADRFDGVNDAYVPPKELDIDASLRLSRSAAESIDPITYEVLRHNLWSVNEEHGETILRASGSPVAAYGCDFNPCLLTEDGEIVYSGPYLQFFASMQDLSVKWTLENRSGNPGIEPGDMFLSNDPWIGANHQLDTNLMCPVFHEGELFCWVTNALHFVELGGSVPGGWNPKSTTRFEEAPLAPCVKIVERDVMRRDLEEWWCRNSRLPNTVALDLRAVIAGAGAARRRVEGLISRYGAPTVKAAMRRIVDDASTIFQRRLQKIPDGVWRERTYVEVANPGDRHVYESHLRMEKVDGGLIFDSAGTHAEAGAINVTYAGWRGGILAVLSSFILPDAMYAIGGAIRHTEFRATSGIWLNASPQAAVANGSVTGVQTATAMANNTVARALHISPEERRMYTANGGVTCWPLIAIGGKDRRGDPFNNVFLDFYSSPLGAFTFRDGVDSGGPYWMAKTVAPNVEQNEEVMPVLYTWQREVINSAGAGRYVGGSTVGIGFTVHGSDDVIHQVAVSGLTHPTAPGLYGGFPGPPNSYLFRRAAGELDDLLFPDAGLVQGQDGTRSLSPKESDLSQRAGDILEVVATGAGGVGDPLERDLAAVQTDIEEERFTPSMAAELFGVVVVDRRLDEPGSKRRRQGLREERLSQAVGPAAYRGPGVVEVIGELTSSLAVGIGEGGGLLICSVRSGLPLCSISDNYKLACARLDLPITAASPFAIDPREFVDDELQFRLFLCPETGALIETEIALAQSPPLHDIELGPRTSASMFSRT